MSTPAHSSPTTLEAALVLIAQQQAEIARLQQSHEGWMRAVAHDLRAPLRHVVSFAPLLQESVQELAAAAPQAPDAAEDAREFTATMEQAARKMSLMLDGMAQVSRVARAPLHLGLVDWSAATQDVVELMQAQQPHVHWELPTAPAPVMADTHSLHTLTQALLENAVKFSARQLQPVVRIHVEPLPHGWWRWVVQDNGAGFDAERASTLGQLFQRMHRDTDFEGAGCGLAVVSTLVERHGGRWQIHAQPQQGCTVSVDLPGAF
ncbi:MAG: two-component sensor histidine kinase [Comamonas sp.]|nr:two-component sensor histidine kinase [Comamonas sp.]